MAKCILAVDDSPSIRQMVTFTLKNAGYDIISASDGLAGLMGCFHVVEEVHQHADAAGVDVEE